MEKKLATLLKSLRDRVEGNSIILDGNGHFPKKLIIRTQSALKEYRIVKTRNGGFILNS